MEATATLKYLKASPQKVRLVADLIRGKKVDEALSILRFTKKSSAKDLEKLLRSAVANAENTEKGVDSDPAAAPQIQMTPGDMPFQMLPPGRQARWTTWPRPSYGGSAFELHWLHAAPSTRPDGG